MPKGMKPSPNFKGNKNSGDKPDSIKKQKWLEEASTIQKLELELERVQDALAKKNLSKEEYDTLRKMVDTLIKNIELLSGRPTQNLNITDNNYDKARGYFEGKYKNNVSE